MAAPLFSRLDLPIGRLDFTFLGGREGFQRKNKYNLCKHSAKANLLNNSCLYCPVIGEALAIRCLSFHSLWKYPQETVRGRGGTYSDGDLPML